MPLPDLRERPRTSKSSHTGSSYDNSGGGGNSYRDKVREKMQTTPRGDRNGGDMNQMDTSRSVVYDNRGSIDLNITREFTFFRPNSSRLRSNAENEVNPGSRLASARSPRGTPRGQNNRDIVIYNRTYVPGDEIGNEIVDDEHSGSRPNSRNFNQQRGRHGNRNDDENDEFTTNSNNNSRRRNNNGHLVNSNSFSNNNRPDSRETFHSGSNNGSLNGCGQVTPRLRSSVLTRRNNDNGPSEAYNENSYGRFVTF
jgi:hypothetical protein